MITIFVADLNVTEATYTDQLGYQVVERGIIGAECAQQMGNEDFTNRSYLTLRPPENEPQVVLRFLTGLDAAYRPMQKSGWNAVEILVKDPERLTAKLDKNLFRLIGPPAYLTSAENILAAQVLGPSGEVLYLTHMKEPELSLLKPKPAVNPVGGTFIMVMGVKDLEEINDFVSSNFRNRLVGPFPFKIDILAKYRGDDPETRYPIMMMKMSGPFGFEFDEYASEVEITDASGGIELVSVSVDTLAGEYDWSQHPKESKCSGLSGYSGLLEFPSGANLQVLAPVI